MNFHLTWCFFEILLLACIPYCDQGHMSTSSISQTAYDASSVMTCECVIGMKRENDLETISFNDSEPKP